MIYLYGIVIPEYISQRDYECMLRSISKGRQLSISKYHFDIDKKRSLFAELLLRYILNRHLFIGEYELSFDKNIYGKPRLSDYQNVFFNYSHSGDWVLCAVGESRMGVDVEAIKTQDIGIAKHFFTSEEYEWLQLIDVEKRNEYFYKLWTLKESYIKAEGKGLTIPLNSFSFDIQNSIELKIQNQIIRNYTFWSNKVDKNHAVALCYDNSVNGLKDIKINILPYEEILQWLKNR